MGMALLQNRNADAGKLILQRKARKPRLLAIAALQEARAVLAYSLDLSLAVRDGIKGATVAGTMNFGPKTMFYCVANWWLNRGHKDGTAAHNPRSEPVQTPKPFTVFQPIVKLRHCTVSCEWFDLFSRCEPVPTPHQVRGRLSLETTRRNGAGARGRESSRRHIPASATLPSRASSGTGWHSAGKCLTTLRFPPG
jgi:hypothetical protein